MSKLLDYLPEKTKERGQLIQARVSVDLVRQVKKVMNTEHLTWSELITACLQYFIDQKKLP